MDGVIAHVAGAGRGSFNHRFAQPSRDAQPLSSFLFPTDLFPYTDLPENDPETGETAGLLDAANRSRTAPKIFFTNTSYEYWGRAASLIHTSPDGLKDFTPGENARIYFLAGLQHFSAAFPAQKVTDRKSTRLNSSHLVISYAVFCLQTKHAETLLRFLIGAAVGAVSRCRALKDRIQTRRPDARLDVAPLAPTGEQQHPHTRTKAHAR